MTSVDLLDLNVIRQLVDDIGGDQGIIPDLVESLEADANRSMQEMHGAIAHADAKQLQQAAHRMKGGFASLGAMLAATLCQALETMGQNGDIVEAGPMMEQLDGICADSIQALREVSLEIEVPDYS